MFVRDYATTSLHIPVGCLAICISICKGNARRGLGCMSSVSLPELIEVGYGLSCLLARETCFYILYNFLHSVWSLCEHHIAVGFAP